MAQYTRPQFHLLDFRPNCLDRIFDTLQWSCVGNCPAPVFDVLLTVVKLLGDYCQLSCKLADVIIDLLIPLLTGAELIRTVAIVSSYVTHSLVDLLLLCRDPIKRLC